MTQEHKDLLIKDLCARLPYGVKVNNKIHGDFIIDGVYENYIFARATSEYGWVKHVDFNIKEIKPYLFPLSSMTEEQREEYHNLCSIGTDGCGDITYFDTYESIDYFNKNKFDYRGLIPIGLTIDATNKNIY